MTARTGHLLTWLASLFAATAFLVVLVVFAREIADYRKNVEAWARRDLRTQAKLTARNNAVNAYMAAHPGCSHASAWTACRLTAVRSSLTARRLRTARQRSAIFRRCWKK